MPREREFFDAVLLGDGTVLVVGDDEDPWLDDGVKRGARSGSALVDRYDPVTDTWTAARSLNQPRTWAATVALPDGSAMVLGGVDADSEPYASTKIFSPAVGRWRAGPLMSRARALPAAITLGDGRVLVVGTPAHPRDASARVNTSEIYDPETGAWSHKARLPWPRARVWELVRLGRSSAFALGTYDTGDAGPTTSMGFMYNARTNRWTRIEAPPWPTSGSAFITLADGDVLAVGGNGGGDCCGGIASRRSVYRLDHATRTWRKVSPLSSPRESVALALLPDGRVVAAGGVRVRESDTDDGTPVRVTELYDPATDTWSRGPNLREAGSGALAVVLADGDVLLLGGSLKTPERLTVGP